MSARAMALETSTADLQSILGATSQPKHYLVSLILEVIAIGYLQFPHYMRHINISVPPPPYGVSACSPLAHA